MQCDLRSVQLSAYQTIFFLSLKSVVMYFMEYVYNMRGLHRLCLVGTEPRPQ